LKYDELNSKQKRKLQTMVRAILTTNNEFIEQNFKKVSLHFPITFLIDMILQLN